MADDPTPLQRRVREAVANELDPLYTTHTADFLQTVLLSLTRGHVLVARTRAGEMVAAFPDGHVTIDGVEVKVSVNQRAEDPRRAYDEFNKDLRIDRGARWAPQFRVPGDTYDAGLIFYALIGWQSADLVAALAMGCAECWGGLVPVDAAGAGRIFVGCACQDFGDDTFLVEREENAVAMEEPGAWFPGAAAVPSASRAPRRASEASTVASRSSAASTSGTTPPRLSSTSSRR